MHDKFSLNDIAAGGVDGNTGITDRAGVHGLFTIECRDKDGILKWEDHFCNLVTTGGQNDLVNKYFSGSAYTATWYGGLIGSGGTLSAADTMSSHAGWSETTAYSNANRPTMTFPGASGGQATANAVTFNMNGNYTVGAFFTSSNNTISGTAGQLFSEGTFTARSGASGDTLNVTYTIIA
jgi:hypothetical protein